MQPGETIASGALPLCPDCGIRLTLEVLQNAASFYIGTHCDCGLYSRESGYFKSRDLASAALLEGNFGR